MELSVCESITRATREEAEAGARHDLDHLRRRAIEAGRERSRQIVKVTVINSETGAVRHNLSGRALRNWYLHVYLNSLRGSLGQPHEPIDAQQVEETASLLRKLRPDREPLQSLHAAGAARKIAETDAAAAAARITERLHATSEVRAIQHAPDHRFESDQLRVHVTRHWYQRCYDNTVDEAVRARHPLAGITEGEELQVARTLATGEVRRVIGRDGIPLVTAHSTNMNELDRRLAAGETGIVPPLQIEVPSGDPLEPVVQRVRQAWQDMPQEERGEWLHAAGTSPAHQGGWAELADDQQLSLVRHYLETHRAELLDSKFERALIRGADAEAARKMFNHAKTLTTTDARLRQVASESRSTSQLDDTTLERVDARTTHRGR